uniref:ATP synthase subunit n=1 Tax=uncultured bacterium pSY1435 TaxID=561717 RepID=C4N421_9BACT|nr:ATP synthase subunit [uncultured bacterium pSY1435]
MSESESESESETAEREASLHEQRTRELAGSIDRTAARRRKAEHEHGPGFGVEASRIGTLGWLLVLPIVGGALIGHLIDRALGTGLRFSLGLLLIGLLLAGYALYRHTAHLPHDS